MRAISFAGIPFGNIGLRGRIIRGLPGEDRSPLWLNRGGGSPSSGGTARGGRPIPILFHGDSLAGEKAMEAALLRLLGALDLEDDTPRPLVAEIDLLGPSPITVQAMATVGPYQWSTDDAKSILVTFFAESARWYEQTETSVSNNLLDGHNHTFLTDLTNWSNGVVTSGVTLVNSRDAAVFSDAAGSHRLQVTANSAGIGAIFERFNTTFLPASPGETIHIIASGRTTNANLRPETFVLWYNAAQAGIGGSTVHQFPTTINTWHREAASFVAPANTAFVRAAVRGFSVTAGPTGSVYFDDIRILSDAGMPVDNPGLARAYPIIKLGWTKQRETTSATQGWMWQKHSTFANTGPRTWANRTICIPLGDTAALVTAGKALASGNDFRVRAFGKEYPRTLTNWNTLKTFCYVNITCPAGREITFDLVYGNPSAGVPETISSLSAARTEPEKFSALDLGGDNGTATSGAVGSLTDTGKVWTVDRFAGGYIALVSGTGSAVHAVRRISSNTATQINVNRDFNVAPAAGTKYVIWMSGIRMQGGAVSSASATVLTDSAGGFFTNDLIGGTLTIEAGLGNGATEYAITANGSTTVTVTPNLPTLDTTSRYLVKRPGYHRYYTEVIKRPADTNVTGGWYADRRYDRPSSIRYGDEIAEGWIPETYLRNSDDFNQSSYVMLEVSVGDFDTFTKLDADRRVGQDRRLSQEGQADGLTITHPAGYSGINFDYEQKNPNGVCKFIFSVQSAGGDDWTIVVEDATARAALTNVGVQYVDLIPLESPLHLYMGQIPVDEVQIPSTASQSNTATVRWHNRLELHVALGTWSVSEVTIESEIFDLQCQISDGPIIGMVGSTKVITVGGEDRWVHLTLGQELWVYTDPNTEVDLVALMETLADPPFAGAAPWAADASEIVGNDIGEIYTLLGSEPFSLPAGESDVLYALGSGGGTTVELAFYPGYVG